MKCISCKKYTLSSQSVLDIIPGNREVIRVARNLNVQRYIFLVAYKDLTWTQVWPPYQTQDIKQFQQCYRQEDISNPSILQKLSFACIPNPSPSPPLPHMWSSGRGRGYGPHQSQMVLSWRKSVYNKVMKVYQHRSNHGFLWTNHLMQCKCTHDFCVKLMKVSRV